MAETYVSRILTNGRRATGVEYLDAAGATHTMDADLVVVAGGAIETPRLLLLSGLENPALGRHLMVHFQTIVVGHFPALSLHPQKGRSVTHVHDDAMVQDDAARAAAKDGGVPWIRGGLVEHSGGGHTIMAARHTPWGRAHAQAMMAGDLRDHMWAFIMQGEDLPYATNAVDLSPSVRDARGYPVARVTYEPGRHELAASKYHGKILQRVLEEMGAEYVIHTSSPGVSYHGIGATPIPESRHVIGTARMGDNPDTSVCDRWGRVHQWDNVIVADSSVFVTATGYGPTLTLVALASRAAHHLAGTEPIGPVAGGAVAGEQSPGTPAPVSAD
jgi:choline dehydrogenase-like flavoprotein